MNKDSVADKKSKPNSIATFAHERAQALEEDNRRLRTRVTELESKVGKGTVGDIGEVIERAIVEVLRSGTSDQRVAAISARLRNVEDEYAAFKIAVDAEKRRLVEKDAVLSQQNSKLLAEVEVGQQREAEIRVLRKTCKDMETRAVMAEDTAKRASEELAQESRRGNRLQEEIISARKDRIEVMSKLHQKHTEEMNLKEAQIGTLKEEQNKRVREVENMSRDVQGVQSLQAETFTVRIGEVSEQVKSLGVAISGIELNSPTKQELLQISEIYEQNADEKVRVTKLEGEYSALVQAISRLAEEYGTVVDDSDLIKCLALGVKSSVEAYRSRAELETKHKNDMREQYEIQVKSLNLAQDKLLRTMEHLIEQLNIVGRSKGLTEEQIASLTQ